MNLTSGQIRSIVEWASSEPPIAEVRLYGNRARQNAKPDSDVDLVVTVEPKNGDSAFTCFFEQRADWSAELSWRVQLPVQIEFAADRAEADWKCRDGFRVLFRRGSA